MWDKKIKNSAAKYLFRGPRLNKTHMYFQMAETPLPGSHKDLTTILVELWSAALKFQFQVSGNFQKFPKFPEISEISTWKIPNGGKWKFPQC